MKHNSNIERKRYENATKEEKASHNGVDTMKYDTIQDEMKEAAAKAETNKDYMKIANEFAIKIIDSDPVFWGVEKRWVSYGTWKARINFANEYHYGDKVAKALTGIRGIITHNEDKVFTLEDFADDIEEALFDIIDELDEED